MIKEDLLKKALNFAGQRVGVKKEEKDLVFHARKSLLFNKEETWIKKEGGVFDVTMGAYDGAEVCELVGTFILHQLGSKYERKNIGLYRDDGLAIFKNISGPEAERIKKDFQKVFRRNGLNITIEFNLNDGTYKPFRKPNDVTNYVHRESNHAPNVIKKLPDMIERRISDLSATKEIFDSSKQYYEEALKRSGYNRRLQFVPPQQTQGRRRNRKRNIIWYNPPFSKNVKTKIAQEFLKLIDKHFPERHKFHKLFNRQNVKVSYSSMPNMKAIINGHNQKVLSEKPSQSERTCNCRNRQQCPLDGHCLTKEVMYEATVEADTPRYEARTYKGITERTFKERFKEHNKTFRDPKLKADSQLSTEVWKIKQAGGTPVITWKILQKSRTYNPSTQRCALCTTEKLAIAEHTAKDLLNKRSEIIAKCRHQFKYQLENKDSKD